MPPMPNLTPADCRYIEEYLQTPAEIANDLSLCLAEAGGNAEMLIALRGRIRPCELDLQADTMARADRESAIRYNASQSITDAHS